MSRIFEILISLAMIGIGALGWLESLKIKGFAFDSLGSRAVPQTLSALLLLAGFWVIVQGFLGARMAMQPAADVGVVDGDEEDDEDVEATGADYVRAVAMFVFSFIFVYAVFVLRIPLSLSVLAFTVAGAQLLVRANRKRATLVAALVGVILGFGTEWIFTSFFFVDLPTFW